MCYDALAQVALMPDDLLESKKLILLADLLAAQRKTGRTELFLQEGHEAEVVSMAYAVEGLVADVWTVVHATISDNPLP